MTENPQPTFSDTSILKNLKDNVKKVKYGEVSVTLRIHDARIVSVTNSVTENTITKGGGQNEVRK